MISSVLRFFSAAFLYQSFSKNRGFLPINYASTMQLYIQLFLSFTGITFATCNHDNCARAVSGIQQGTTHLAIASSDCSNFLRTTVTAPASTVSVTVTSIVDASITFGPVKRQVAGTIPSYASDCVGAAAYSSACSCFGVTPATITAPASVSMVDFKKDMTDQE
jgi:hypothetical protein